jgi:hypothetical protein
MKYVSKIPGRMAFLAAFVLLLSGPSGIACALAAPGNAAEVKPALAQVSPAPSENTVAAPMPFKGRHSPQALAPWTVSLAASPEALWPTQYSTLTATTNQELGPTPYYLSIYDRTSETFVAKCGHGTTCSVKVTQEQPGYRRYMALVSEDPRAYPPAGLQAHTFWEVVYWREVFSTLQAVPATLNPGENATLTATTSDMSGSPFYLSIYDATTGTPIAACIYGSPCSVAVSQADATTHRFTAYVADLTPDHPPSHIQTTSNNAYITWTNSGYRISLAHSFIAEGVVRLTSTTNVDIGPTPYWTAIYNQRTGARVAICGYLTTCSVDVAVEELYTSFIAILAADDPALPPRSIQATSDPQNVFFVRIN